MHSAVVHRHQYQRANKTIMHSLPISRCWTEHCIHLKLTARMHALNWAAPSFADLGTLTVPHFLCVSRDFIALQTCVWACLFESFNIFIWRKKNTVGFLHTHYIWLIKLVHQYMLLFVCFLQNTDLSFSYPFLIWKHIFRNNQAYKTFIKLIFGSVSANVAVSFIC